MPLLTARGHVADSYANTEQLLQNVTDLSEWIRGYGIRTQNTRIEKYIQHLKRVIGPKKIPMSESIFFECWELKRIFDGLHDWQDHPTALVSKLKQLSRGHQFFQQETDAHPRNTAFELHLAAAFREVGITPTFDDELLEDVGIEFEGRKFRFQCKRLKNEARTLQRMSEGAKQLKRITDANTVKVVAVDIAKAGNTHRLSSPSGADAARLVDQEIGAWYSKYLKDTEWFGGHSHVAAVLFRNAALNVLREGTFQHVYMMGQIVWKEHRHAECLDRLYESIAATSGETTRIDIAI